MALKIFWTTSAVKRFDSIIEYINIEWGEHSESIFVKKVYDFLDILYEFPEIGSIENKKLNIRGFMIVKQITLFYQIRKDKIVLLNFYDNRQKPKRKKY